MSGKEKALRPEDKKAEEEKADGKENVLSESELDSVGGGVAPIIKPPTP